jgi:hypothetical protein
VLIKLRDGTFITRVWLVDACAAVFSAKWHLALEVRMVHNSQDRPVGGNVTHATHQRRDNSGFLGYAGILFIAVTVVLVIAAIAGGFISSRSQQSVIDKGADTASADREGALFVLNPDEGPFVQMETETGSPQLVIYFQANREDLAVDFQQAVGPIQAWAQANPDDQFEVVGFEDNRVEGDTANPLAERRASAVAEALASAGIASDRILIRNAQDGEATLRSDDSTGRVEVRTVSR